MIKALVLDFYGVIQTDNLLLWIDKHHLTRPTLKATFDDICRRLDLDEITLENYYEELAAAVDRPLAEVKDELQAEVIINQPLLDLVTKFRENGVKCAVLSNDGSSLRGYMQEKAIDGYFDEIFVSGEIGLIKPDDRIYEYVVQKLGVEPEEAIFFDDRQSNVDGALRAGLQAKLYTSLADVQSLL